MHELSIAMSIVDGASEEALRYPDARVDAVRVKVGKLSGVFKDALLFSYEVASAGTELEGSSLLIDDVVPAIYCDNCKSERELPSIQSFACPVCGKPSAEIVRGRELVVVGLDLVNKYATATC